MSRGSFPAPASRFDSVGFSEIVKVRNRVLELLAAGQKVWRFEGGEPYMPTPQPIKDAMTRRSRATRRATRPPRDCRSCARRSWRRSRAQERHPGRRRQPDRRQRRDARPLRRLRDAARPGRRSPDVLALLDADRGRDRVPRRRSPCSFRRRRRAGTGSSATLGEGVTPRTKLLYWNSPVNPTGEVFSRAESRRSRRSSASTASR